MSVCAHVCVCVCACLHMCVHSVHACLLVCMCTCVCALCVQLCGLCVHCVCVCVRARTRTCVGEGCLVPVHCACGELYAVATWAAAQGVRAHHKVGGSARHGKSTGRGMVRH